MKKALAFLAGQHARCGQNSGVSNLSQFVIRDILKFYLMNRIDYKLYNSSCQRKLTLYEDNKLYLVVRWQVDQFNASVSLHETVRIIDYKHMFCYNISNSVGTSTYVLTLNSSVASRPLWFRLGTNGLIFESSKDPEPPDIRRIKKFSNLVNRIMRQYGISIFCLPP
jgi:hypothetical protein